MTMSLWSPSVARESLHPSTREGRENREKLLNRGHISPTSAAMVWRMVVYRERKRERDRKSKRETERERDRKREREKERGGRKKERDRKREFNTVRRNQLANKHRFELGGDGCTAIAASVPIWIHPA